MRVHPTAVIDPSAQLGDDVVIGPYTVVGPHCVIGDGTMLGSHVVIESYTRLGKGCKVSPGAVLGGPPQDLKFKDEPSYVVIGDRAIIRECVTVNRATGRDEETRVGSDGMIMAYSHIAHNCRVGDGVVLANNVQMAGHVTVGDYAFISGTCAIHQFVTIGRMAIIAGFSGTRQDIPPFAMTEGRPQATIVGINKVGLKRRGYGLEQRQLLKKAYYYLWFSGLNRQQSVQAVLDNVPPDPLVDELLEFVQNSKRGIHQPDDDVHFEGAKDFEEPEAVNQPVRPSYRNPVASVSEIS